MWIGRLTNAWAVEKPIPPRLTPVMRIVLPRMPSGKALATSMASVLVPNSKCVVEGMTKVSLGFR